MTLTLPTTVAKADGSFSQSFQSLLFLNDEQCGIASPFQRIPFSLSASVICTFRNENRRFRTWIHWSIPVDLTKSGESLYVVEYPSQFWKLSAWNFCKRDSASDSIGSVTIPQAERKRPTKPTTTIAKKSNSVLLFRDSTCRNTLLKLFFVIPPSQVIRKSFAVRVSLSGRVKVASQNINLLEWRGRAILQSYLYGAAI